MILVSTPGPHKPVGSLVVKVKVTVPAVVSAKLGVYVAFRVVAFGLKVPVPLVVQVAEVAAPLNEPFN